MYNGRKAIAIGLVTCLLTLPLSDLAASAQAKGRSKPAKVKQQVNQLEVDVTVIVKLKGGKKVQGAIWAIDDDGFVLSSGQSRPQRRIAYDQVARLEPFYQAASHPADQAKVRRVVTALGIDKRVRVEIAGVEKTVEIYVGRIEAIEPDQFTLTLIKRRGDPVLEVPYRDVLLVQQQGKPKSDSEGRLGALLFQ